jgi:hypothetical protein
MCSVTDLVSSAATVPTFRRAVARSAIAAGLALASFAAPAQGGVTLYGGARGGGDFADQNAGGATIRLDSGAAASLSADWLLNDGRQGQVFYSFQRSALPGSVANRTSDIAVNVSYLHIGGRVFFDGSYATSGSYLVGGLGITHLSPSLDGLSSETRPSINLGLGYQWMLARPLALRTELRGYATLINSNGGFFCSGGACVVKIRGDTLLQVEGLLGLSIAF